MGKIQIDLKKLTNGKDKNTGEKLINTDTELIIEQLKQHINNGNNGCFLISGYRGTGKTTTIENLEEIIDNDKVLFIKLNISKYEEYSYIMRKLIREIYRVYTSKNTYEKFSIRKMFNKKYIKIYINKKVTWRKESDFRKTIKLLYDRTFNEILETNIKKNISTLSIGLSKESNIKSLLVLIMFLGAMIYPININLKNTYILNILNFFSVIWGVILTFKIIIECSHDFSISNERSRKSLYDNEIAEVKLRDLLKDLKKLEYKVTIVLDELDKIDNEQNINNILSEFKPLLISDLATFIVISGQKLYYQLSNSSIIDDSLISSIFSKTIHTPLASHNILNKLFINSIIESDVDDNTIKKYIDSVILKSNSTIRSFINIIYQDIIWEKDKSYIHIKQKSIGKYETDSKILKAIDTVIKESINPFDDVDIAIKDFFISQLYLWSKKMKLIGKDTFNINDILNFNKDYSGTYPSWCEIQLNGLLNNLLEKLTNNENIMQKEEKESDGEKIISYKWIDEIDINEESYMEKNSKAKLRFIDEFIVVEKYCRAVYNMIDKGNTDRSFKNIIIGLFKSAIIDENTYEQIKVCFNVRNQIVHGQDVEDIKEYDLNIRRLVPRIVEEYSYYICKSYLELKGYKMYTINNSIDMGYDFIAKSSDINKDDLLIVIKYKRYLSKMNENQLISRLLAITKSYNSEKQFKLVALVYTEEKGNNNYIDRTYSSDNLNIIYISNILSLDIDNYLNNIIDNEDSNMHMDEIAFTID